MTIIKRSKKIMARLIKHPSFRSGHERVDFGRGYIGYYIAGTDTSYFSLKFAGVEVTIANDEIVTVQTQWAKNAGFVDLCSWLTEIEELIPPEDEIAAQVITIGNIRYVRENKK